MIKKKGEKNPEFGQRLAGELHRRGLTNRAFARKLGIHENSMSKYRHGGIPDRSILLAISRELNCSIDWLLTGRGEGKPVAAFETAAAEFDPRISAIGERRTFNRVAGLTEEQAMSLAYWLRDNAKYKDLFLAWIEARQDGRLKCRDADLLEVEFAAKAGYLLEEIRREDKEKASGG